MDTLGGRLGELLAAQGYTGKEGRERFIALLKKKDVKVSQSTFYYWLANTRRPELPTLVAILDLLGVHDAARDEIARLALPDGLLSATNRPTDDDVPTVHE
jgi:hypothetical protein